MDVQSRIRALAALVLAVGILNTAGAQSPAALEECTSNQWANCWCQASGACQAANGDPQPGTCWQGIPEVCEQHGNGWSCSGSCSQLAEEWCEPLEFCT